MTHSNVDAPITSAPMLFSKAGYAIAPSMSMSWLSSQSRECSAVAMKPSRLDAVK